MMPVEDHVLQLGKMVSAHNKAQMKNRAKPQNTWTLKVDWEVGKSKVNQFKHFANDIAIKWEVSESNPAPSSINKEEETNTRGKRNRDSDSEAQNSNGADSPQTDQAAGSIGDTQKSAPNKKLTEGNATFNPLHGPRRITTLDVGVLEEALVEARKTIGQPNGKNNGNGQPVAPPKGGGDWDDVPGLIQSPEKTQKGGKGKGE
jgi:hypothetical protein